jgi:hypothetical protein
MSAGVVITIDELQLTAKPELGDFAATLQQHVPDDWPLVVVLAGLPNIRGSDKGVTYLERAEWHMISLLDQADAVEALQAPAKTARRPMTDQAAEQLAAASGGYPYAIQLIGHLAWRASTGDATIDVAHVSPAIRDAHEELATSLYAARWEDFSERERGVPGRARGSLSIQPAGDWRHGGPRSRQPPGPCPTCEGAPSGRARSSPRARSSGSRSPG